MKKMIKETAIEILEEFTKGYSLVDEERMLEEKLKRLCDDAIDAFAVMLKDKLDRVISEVKLLSPTETGELQKTIRDGIRTAQIGVLETVRDVTVSEVKYRAKWRNEGVKWKDM